MGKQIVVCCDGTWDVPDMGEHGLARPTNVAKLALGATCGDGCGQVLFYEPGVGTTADERVMGGAFGYGLSRNVRNCYRFLAESYEAGDRLFLFGFSRGAYTARSLAGLIRNCGILRPENAGLVDEAFAFYRDRTSRTHPRALASQVFRRAHSHCDEQEIHFIGVWDTVGALGIPEGIPWLDHLDRLVPDFGFHDTQLSRSVRHAYQALAIDEERAPFQPTLWTTDDAADGQIVEQVWFSGTHTDVGGSSPDTGLSDIALLWMVARARDCGLKIDDGRLAAGMSDGTGSLIEPDYAAPIHDSRGLLQLFAYHRLQKLAVDGAPAQSIASTAARRYEERFDGYSPPGMDRYMRALPVMPVLEQPAGAVTA